MAKKMMLVTRQVNAGWSTARWRLVSENGEWECYGTVDFGTREALDAPHASPRRRKLSQLSARADGRCLGLGIVRRLHEQARPTN